MSEEAGVGPVLLAVIEAMLFVTDRPLTLADIVTGLDNEDVEESTVQTALSLLVDRHRAGADEGRGFQLAETGEGWQFRTAPEVTQWLAGFTGLRPVRLSRAALESLAIVAYRQPCTRAEIERIRGVDSGGVLRALLDRRMLRVAGRRNEPGRPNVYATTREFLDTFGLTSLQEMPSLREFTMLGEEDMEAVSALFEDPNGENQVTMQEFAQNQSLVQGEGPTPGLEPVPGETADLEVPDDVAVGAAPPSSDVPDGAVSPAPEDSLPAQGEGVAEPPSSPVGAGA